MPLTAQDLGLVPAASVADTAAPVRVRLLRAICVRGKAVAAGTELDVPPRWASELCFAGKAERLQAAPAAAAETPPKSAARKAAATKEA